MIAANVNTPILNPLATGVNVVQVGSMRIGAAAPVTITQVGYVRPRCSLSDYFAQRLPPYLSLSICLASRARFDCPTESQSVAR